MMLVMLYFEINVKAEPPGLVLVFSRPKSLARVHIIAN